MNLKLAIKKFLNYLLAPKGITHVSVSQINYGGELLAGRNILITGGGSGIGFAMAKKFVSEGANVVIVGRNEVRLKKAISLIGNRCQYVVHDVTKVEMAPDLIKKANELIGPVDCFVGNAGISYHEGNILEVTINGFDEQMNVNLRANYFYSQAFIKLTADLPKRDILIISSSTGNQLYDIPYGMAKAALNSMIQRINKDNYRYGLRVNAIAPGLIPTEMTKSYIDISDDNLFCSESCGRFFLPEEIAEVATFLLSDGARLIAGEVISCDGGNSQKPIWK